MKNKKNSSQHKEVPSETIKRIARYRNILRRLQKQGIQTVSSSELAKDINGTPEQVRKDFSYFGGFGKPRVGYEVDHLLEQLEHILGLDNQWNIALVGVGRLGSALLQYPGFSAGSITIAAAFDNDPKKINRKIKNVIVQPIAHLPTVIKETGIKIGMLCVQAQGAQQATDAMVKAGIKAILNFAPINVEVPPGILVSRVDMAAKLQGLIYFVKQDTM